MDDDGDSRNLLDAAKDLANAFSNLLGSLHPGDTKVYSDNQNWHFYC